MQYLLIEKQTNPNGNEILETSQNPFDVVDTLQWVEIEESVNVSPQEHLYKDGEIVPKPEPLVPLKINYTHKQWIERLGSDFVTLQQLRDNNDLLPPSEKNYELVRAFTLFDVSDFISLDDGNLHTAFAVFMQLGLMTEERAQEILTPNEPAQPDDPK